MLKKAVLVLISVVLVIYLMRQIDVRQVFFAIIRVPLPYLIGSFTLFILGHFSRALRFKVLLRDKAPLGGLFSIVSVQTAAVGFLPLRSGEFSLMLLLKKEYGLEYPLGAAVLVLAKALDFIAVVSLFFISFSSLPHVPAFFRELLPWAGGLFFLTAASFVLLGRSREIYAVLPAFFKEGPLASSMFVQNVKKVFKGAEIIRSKKTLVLSLLTTLLIWAMLYGSSYLLYWGIGLKLTLLEMTFITTSFSIFSNLPIHSPGGFGTIESFWTLLLVALGVPKDFAIATGFATHLITIGFTLIFMLYGLKLIRKKRLDPPQTRLDSPRAKGL
jgi:glycosyltransferase 2 family protein